MNTAEEEISFSRLLSLIANPIPPKSPRSRPTNNPAKTKPTTKPLINYSITLAH